MNLINAIADILFDKAVFKDNNIKIKIAGRIGKAETIINFFVIANRTEANFSV